MTTGAENGMVLGQDLERIFASALRDYDLPFTPEDVYCITGTTIPNYVKFIISLGKKFAFIPLGKRSATLIPEKLQLFAEGLKSRSHTAGQLFSIKHELNDLFALTQGGTKDVCSETLHFITHWMGYTKSFLKENQHLLVTTADKGGKLVIIDAAVYEQKVEKHLEEFVVDGTYERLPDSMSFEELRSDLESAHKALRDKVNPFLSLDNVRRLAFEPYVMAKLVLTIKVHKPGFPTRPIIAAPERWNKSLSRWVLRLLTVIAASFDSIKVKNSNDLVERLSKVGDLPTGHKLSTFDYVSMFTNVPFYVPREIVVGRFYMLNLLTRMPRDVFMEILDFIIDSSSYFSYGDVLLKQSKGLTMGNELSQVLADIATGHATMVVKASLDEQRVSFLCKYVDDFLTAMDEEATNQFHTRMHRMIDGLQLQRTDEDEHGQVSYLDVLICRRPDGSMTTVWWQKECAKGSLLNFYSNHPRMMKINIMAAYIKHALLVTSPIAYQQTIKKLKNVLRKSSFPMCLIQPALCNVLECIGSTYTTSETGAVDHSINLHLEIAASTPTERAGNVYDYDDCEFLVLSQTGLVDQDVNIQLELKERWLSKALSQRPMVERTTMEPSSKSPYMRCPFLYAGHFKQIDDFVRENGFHVRLAPSPICTNATVGIFSSMKKRDTMNSRKFAVFSISCLTCKEVFVCSTGNLDLGRYLSRLEGSSVGTLRHSKLKIHRQSNPTHVLSYVAENLSTYATLDEASIAYAVRSRTS